MTCLPRLNIAGLAGLVLVAGLAACGAPASASTVDRAAIERQVTAGWGSAAPAPAPVKRFVSPSRVAGWPECPATHPILANTWGRDDARGISGTYFTNGGRYSDGSRLVGFHRCYRDELAAVADGFRPAPGAS